MSRLMIALFAAAGLLAAGPAASQMTSPRSAATPMSKDGYTLAKKSAEAQYKLDKEACLSMSGNAKDVCIAVAKGKESIANAEADAAYENTAKARSEARMAHTQAAYDVAIEKCDDMAGNPKDVCVKEAKAALVKGKGSAKVGLVTAETQSDAAAKQAEARKDASTEKNDADYKVALEKCDALAGAAKDSCVGSAKTQYGKS